MKDTRVSFLKRKAKIVEAIKKSNLKSNADYPKLMIDDDGLVKIKGIIAKGGKVNMIDIKGVSVYADVELCQDVDYTIRTGVYLNKQEFVQLAYELGGYNVGNNLSKINAKFAFSDCDRGQKCFNNLKKKQKIFVKDDGTRIAFASKFFI